MVRLGVDSRLLIGDVYGSPSSSTENDVNLFNLLKYVTKQFSVSTLIVSKFNFRGVQWDSGDLSMKGLPVTVSEEMFINTLRENLFVQLMDRPTRQRSS